VRMRVVYYTLICTSSRTNSHVVIIMHEVMTNQILLRFQLVVTPECSLSR